MAHVERIESGGHRTGLLPFVGQIALGFLYWLFFLLVLEPDNIVRALHAGGGLAWSQEIMRIMGASLLGASVTPLLFALVHRFPIEGNTVWRHGALQAVGAAAMAAALIALSCVLAEWFLASEHRSLATALGEEFVANWPLLVFGVAGLIAIGHAARFFDQIRRHERRAGTESPATAYLARVAVKTRGTVSFVELNDVEWIEAQGNYLALHVGTATHLIRESLGRFEPRLDPKRFARIHRRTIVAIACVREIEPLGAGDALLRLNGGTELRVSRSFRAGIVACSKNTS